MISMSRRIVIRLLTALCLTLLGTALPAMAQENESSQSSNVFGTPARPKDALTRAKAHTELASLYFQNGT